MSMSVPYYNTHTPTAEFNFRSYSGESNLLACRQDKTDHWTSQCQKAWAQHFAHFECSNYHTNITTCNRPMPTKHPTYYHNLHGSNTSVRVEGYQDLEQDDSSRAYPNSSNEGTIPRWRRQTFLQSLPSFERTTSDSYDSIGDGTYTFKGQGGSQSYGMVYEDSCNLRVAPKIWRSISQLSTPVNFMGGDDERRNISNHTRCDGMSQYSRDWNFVNLRPRYEISVPQNWYPQSDHSSPPNQSLYDSPQSPADPYASTDASTSDHHHPVNRPFRSSALMAGYQDFQLERMVPFHTHGSAGETVVAGTEVCISPALTSESLRAVTSLVCQLSKPTKKITAWTSIGNQS